MPFLAFRPRFPPALSASLALAGRLSGPRWSTSSFGAAADTSPVELLALSDHLQRCSDSRGRFFAMLCLSDSVDRFLAPRSVSIVVAIALLGWLTGVL